MKPMPSYRTYELVFVGLSAFLLLTPSCANAADASATAEINWFFLAIGLLGGLSLFLYGMERMSDALKNVAGEKPIDFSGC